MALGHCCSVHARLELGLSLLSCRCVWVKSASYGVSAYGWRRFMVMVSFVLGGVVNEVNDRRFFNGLFLG